MLFCVFREALTVDSASLYSQEDTSPCKIERVLLLTLCSVVIPTFNRPKMIIRAVKSALDAIPLDGEVIVVDDGSQEPAIESLSEIIDQRLIVLKNDGRHGGGGSAARNLGLSHASGAVLFLLDDDDEILPHYCQAVLEVALNPANMADYGFSAIELVSGDKSPKIKSRVIRGGIVAQETPFRLTTFPFSIGFWMSRDTYNEIGPIDETLPTNSDTEYSLRLRAFKKRMWYTPHPGVRIHQHDGQGDQLGQVTNRTPYATRATVFQTIMERHSAYLAHDSSARRFLLKRHLTLAAKAGQPPIELRKVGGVSTLELWLMRAYFHALRIALTKKPIKSS